MSNINFSGKILKLTLLAFPWLALSPAYAAFQASVNYRYRGYDGYSNFQFEKTGDRKLLFADEDRKVYLTFVSENEESKVFSIEDFEGDAREPERKIIVEGLFDANANRGVNSVNIKKQLPNSNKSLENYSFDIQMREIRTPQEVKEVGT